VHKSSAAISVIAPESLEYGWWEAIRDRRKATLHPAYRASSPPQDSSGPAARLPCCPPHQRPPIRRLPHSRLDRLACRRPTFSSAYNWSPLWTEDCAHPALNADLRPNFAGGIRGDDPLIAALGAEAAPASSRPIAVFDDFWSCNDPTKATVRVRANGHRVFSRSIITTRRFPHSPRSSGSFHPARVFTTCCPRVLSPPQQPRLLFFFVNAGLLITLSLNSAQRTSHIESTTDDDRARSFSSGEIPSRSPRPFSWPPFWLSQTSYRKMRCRTGSLFARPVCHRLMLLSRLACGASQKPPRSRGRWSSAGCSLSESIINGLVDLLVDPQPQRFCTMLIRSVTLPSAVPPSRPAAEVATAACICLGRWPRMGTALTDSCSSRVPRVGSHVDE